MVLISCFSNPGTRVNVRQPTDSISHILATCGVKAQPLALLVHPVISYTQSEDGGVKWDGSLTSMQVKDATLFPMRSESRKTELRNRSG